MDLLKLIAAKRLEVSNFIAEVEAMATLAESEKRDITADEKSRMESITNAGGLLEVAGKEIEALEARQAVMAKAKLHLTPKLEAHMGTSFGGGSNDAQQVRIPARAKRNFNSKSFGSIEEAYSAGQWLMATLGSTINPDASVKSRQWCVDNGIMASMSEGVNTAGGFLVPDFYETSIIRIVEAYGVFRQNSYVYPMGSDVVRVPRRNGGFTVYYVGENAAITASDLAFNQVQLTARKPSILTQISSELREDEMVGLAGLLTQEFGYALAVAEDQAGFLGDGTSTYGGIVGLKNAVAAGCIFDAASTHTAFSTLALLDFNKAKGLLPAYTGAQNKWYISKQGFALSMEALASAAGGITMMDLQKGMQPTFLGDPVVFTQALPITTAAQVSTIVAWYGDLSLATTMGTRRQMTIKSDESYYFNQDAVAIRCTERYDIVVHEVGTSSVAGPIIALKTASS